MATLISKITAKLPTKGAATADTDTAPAVAFKDVAAGMPANQHAWQYGVYGSIALAAEGVVLAEATAYRTVDRKLLSHTDGMVSPVAMPRLMCTVRESHHV